MRATRQLSPLRRKVRAQVSGSILDAVEAVALEAGLGGITVHAVAERAGVAVGTLYNYFPDTDAMLTALFRARRDAIVPRIAAAIDASKQLAFEPRLRDFVHQLLSIYEGEDRFLRVSVLVDRDGSKSKPRDTALMCQTIEALEQIMRAGAREKLLPARRAPIYARMMHGALRSMFLWQLCARGQARGDEQLLVVETFLRGVLPIH
ncbi:MAG TPA: TetR/AcrR family transcriptional regulator, partial [Myxococcota bacterium]